MKYGGENVGANGLSFSIHGFSIHESENPVLGLGLSGKILIKIGRNQGREGVRQRKKPSLGMEVLVGSISKQRSII